MTVFFHQVPAVRVAIAHAVEEARAAKQADPLAPITFLLPRREDAAPVRRALGDVMGVTMLQFYGLGERILDEAGSPVRELDDLAARRLVRQCLDDMAVANELSTFATVVDKPGFIRLLVAWLREMKAQAITPEMVTADADRSGRRRDRQLAGLYWRYQTFLIENDYSDGEGLLWLAAEELEDKPALLARLGSLHVIGFDRFSPVQERVLAALAGRIDSLTLYLLW
ncbi:MAG TPA: hypothetical protein VLA15_07755, partial [Desulfurivibrionaceae bacterium]|nr:hypothetical protein [Desulfurivibrionaceae bacterium]